jgi:hypothetical protein
MLVLLEIEVFMLVVSLLSLFNHFISYQLMATCLLSLNGLFVRINSYFYKFWHNGWV